MAHVFIAGSNFVLVEPEENEEGFFENHLAGETTWFGDRLVVEQRYLEPLLEGLAAFLRGDLDHHLE